MKSGQRSRWTEEELASLRFGGWKVPCVDNVLSAPRTPQGVRISDDAVYGSLELTIELLGFGAL